MNSVSLIILTFYKLMRYISLLSRHSLFVQKKKPPPRLLAYDIQLARRIYKNETLLPTQISLKNFLIHS